MRRQSSSGLWIVAIVLLVLAGGAWVVWQSSKGGGLSLWGSVDSFDELFNYLDDRGANLSVYGRQGNEATIESEKLGTIAIERCANASDAKNKAGDNPRKLAWGRFVFRTFHPDDMRILKRYLN